MTTPVAYVREIKSVDDELKRVNKKAKDLRTQKRKAQDRLYAYMEKNKLETYEGITKKSIKPKEKAPRKSKTQKKEEAVILFSQAGVKNAERLYDQFLEMQKVKKESEAGFAKY